MTAFIIMTLLCLIFIFGYIRKHIAFEKQKKAHHEELTSLSRELLLSESRFNQLRQNYKVDD